MRGLLLALLLVTGATPVAADLLIVGGALKSDNAEIYQAFVQGLLPEGPVIIIPAASGSPARSAAAFAGDLKAYGVAPERIRIFPLAVRDDAETPNVDESEWRDNAWDTDLLAGLQQAAGVWFTGGDQMRIASTMLGDKGRESPLLVLLRSRLSAGAMVGGTSAGAAIMSRHMITGGSSFEALQGPLKDYQAIEEQESGHLSLHVGLGFLPQGLVDQHFDRKARLGRLVRALSATGDQRGFGVDEDTALHVVQGTQRARVLGRGTVTVIDASDVSYDFEGTDLASNLRISVLPSGSLFSLFDLKLIDPAGEQTVGNEYFRHPVQTGGGMAFANQQLPELLGNDLLDNSATRSVSRISLDDSGRALFYRFAQTDNSQAWYDRTAAHVRYTAAEVRLDIFRRSVKFSP